MMPTMCFHPDSPCHPVRGPVIDRWMWLMAWLVLVMWAVPIQAGEDPQEHADEVLFRVNQLTLMRSQIELEFLAEIPVEQLVKPGLSVAERKQLLETTWQNAVKEAVESAILEAQSRDELDYLDFVSRIEPRLLNEAVDQNIRILEQRYGGAEYLARQMKRFHINEAQLRKRLVVTFGINMFLRRKFSTLTSSTPDQQRDWYRAHPLEFAQSGKLRLQRLAVRFAPGPDQSAEAIAAGVAKIGEAWQAAKDPDGFARALAAGKAYLPAWTVIDRPADEEADWIDFDKLPDALRTAARLPLGTVLPPLPLATLQDQQALGPAGALALRAPETPDRPQEVWLLFRIAEQKVVLHPFDDVQGVIRARLDDDIFRSAKREFLADIRKRTRVIAQAGNEPKISPWLLKLDFPAAVPPAPTPQAPGGETIAPPGEAPAP